MARSDFQAWVDGAQTDLYTLHGADGIAVDLCNYGARIVGIQVPDGQGGRVEVTLGYDSLAAYLNGQLSMGAWIGRWAGRLRNGQLQLPDGKAMQLPCNGGRHAVHGGPRGSRFRTFKVDEVRSDALVLSHVFRPEDDGVPGSLRLQLTYQVLPGQALRISWQAQAGDTATLAQFTAHPFFNLAGEGTALDHELQVPASRFVPLADDVCPIGSTADVDHSPLDFRLPRTLRQALAAPHAQLLAAKGLDHYLVLDRVGEAQASSGLAARLRCPRSGRRLDIFSTEPGVQLYAGHGLTGELPRDLGRGPWHWAPGDAVCLEPMSWPDAPNQPGFPNPWLAPGATRYGEILYRFS